MTARSVLERQHLETIAMPVYEMPENHDQAPAFDDRKQAGRALAGMLEEFRGSDAMVLGIPNRGLPVAVAVADALRLPLDVAVIRKVTFPWNPESGFGAVAFDGTVHLHEGLVRGMGLAEPDIGKGTRLTLKAVQEETRRLRGRRPFPDLAGRTVILVDEGLASSLTMETAVEAVGHFSPADIVTAVATGYESSLQRLGQHVPRVYCANVRGGWGFEVADAFRRGGEVSDDEAESILRKAWA